VGTSGLLRKLRLHLEERDGTLRTAAQLLFTGKDASLYLVPYAERGEYFYGEHAVAAGETEFVIKFREHLTAADRPKLSIHESGAVHIYAKDAPKAGPVKIRPLTDFRGEHLASVRWDLVKRMPVHTGRTRTTGQQRDYAFGVPNDVESGVLLIYANGERNAFQTEQVQFAIQVERGSAPPVFFGVAAVARDRLGAEDEGGVSVLAGFDALKGPTEPDNFLFLRAL
jgi:hypothetical protein